MFNPKNTLRKRVFIQSFNIILVAFLLNLFTLKTAVLLRAIFLLFWACFAGVRILGAWKKLNAFNKKALSKRFKAAFKSFVKTASYHEATSDAIEKFGPKYDTGVVNIIHVSTNERLGYKKRFLAGFGKKQWDEFHLVCADIHARPFGNFLFNKLMTNALTTMAFDSSKILFNKWKFSTVGEEPIARLHFKIDGIFIPAYFKNKPK